MSNFDLNEFEAYAASYGCSCGGPLWVEVRHIPCGTDCVGEPEPDDDGSSSSLVLLPRLNEIAAAHVCPPPPPPEPEMPYIPCKGGCGEAGSESWGGYCETCGA